MKAKKKWKQQKKTINQPKGVQFVLFANLMVKTEKKKVFSLFCLGFVWIFFLRNLWKTINVYIFSCFKCYPWRNRQWNEVLWISKSPSVVKRNNHKTESPCPRKWHIEAAFTRSCLVPRWQSFRWTRINP